MTNVVRRPLWAGMVAGALGLVLQGCNPTAAPPAVSAPVQAVNPHDEAARLIKTLDLSGHQQDSARDYDTAQIAQTGLGAVDFGAAGPRRGNPLQTPGLGHRRVRCTDLTNDGAPRAEAPLWNWASKLLDLGLSRADHSLPKVGDQAFLAVVAVDRQNPMIVIL